MVSDRRGTTLFPMGELDGIPVALVASKQIASPNLDAFHTCDDLKWISQKDENQSKMDNLSMEWKRTVQNQGQVKNTKVRVNTEESAVKPEPELKNLFRCNS
ncbi:hypothetical protein Tco_0487182 [Tanacetum coccineum]